MKYPMKNNVIYLILVLLISIFSTLISYRTYQSFVQARTFTLHFNTRQFEKADQKFIDNLIYDIPNLSATTIPLKAVKALYLTSKKEPTISDVTKAKSYLNRAIKDNPYIKIPEAELSKIYFMEEKKDSSLYFGKIAFEGLRKNPIHFAHYTAALASVGDTATIRKIYENLDYKNFLIDKLFLTAMTEVMDKDNTKKITEAVEYLSVDDDQYKINVYILNHGRENVLKAIDLNKKAETFFEQGDFQKAVKTFEEALSYNPSEPAFYQNIWNCYMKFGDQKKAQFFLKTSIDSFNTKKGKSEYLFGLSKLLSGEDQEGCRYIAKSHNEYRYKLAYSVYQKFCN